MADDFDAFISYSRADRVFAEKLSATLQSFTPPADLAVPQRSPRIFRDVSDLTGNDYFATIDSQLRRSRKLILLCSPAARQSTFVDDEIRRFLEAQGVRHIIPVLVDGIPNNEAQAGQDALMAFPQSLCDALSMPLAVGYRQWDPDADPIDAGRFKDSWYTLLAGLYDVSRADIEARDSARRARERAAWSRRLATTSMRALDVEPELAVLLAASAVRITQAPDGAVVPEAEEALHTTIEQFQRRRTVPLLTLHGHEGPLWDVQYSPDGTALVTASEDCSWRLWEAASGRQLASVTGTPMHGPVKGAKFSPDGLCLVTAHLDSRAKHWTQSSARSISLNAHCWQVAYSPSGKAVATAGLDGAIHVWDLETGEALLTYELPAAAVAVAFSRNGDRIAGGGNSGMAKIWDSAGETELKGHTGTVMAVTFSPDDHRVRRCHLASVRRQDRRAGRRRAGAGCGFGAAWRKEPRGDCVRSVWDARRNGLPRQDSERLGFPRAPGDPHARGSHGWRVGRGVPSSGRPPGNRELRPHGENLGRLSAPRAADAVHPAR